MKHPEVELLVRILDMMPIDMLLRDVKAKIKEYENKECDGPDLAGSMQRLSMRLALEREGVEKVVRDMGNLSAISEAFSHTQNNS